MANRKKVAEPPKTENTEFTYTLSKASNSDFDTLYNKEAYCAEGMPNASSDEAAKFLLNYFSKFNGCAKHINFYYCYGKDLNNYYHLTEDNRYPDDLGIFFIDWSNFDRSFDVAGHKGNLRYFSDVVDNNARKEIRKGNPYYKNYHSLYGDDWFYSTI